MMIRSLAFMLLTAALAMGQQPAKKDPPKEPAKPAPGSLEDTLEKALRNSADIKAAESKVRDAEAELNKVRHQVLTKATAIYSDLNLARRMLGIAEQTLARQSEFVKKGQISTETMMASQALVEKHRGEVEKLEAELKSLRGEFAIKTSVVFDPDGHVLYMQNLHDAFRAWDVQTGKLLERVNSDTGKAATVQTPMGERVRKLLEQEVDWTANNLDLSEMFKWLMDATKTDIPHRDLTGQTATTITLKAKMPLGAWFQALEDSDPTVAIVVRDYGLLMTKKDRVPKGAVGVSELWKAKESKPKEEPKAK